MIYLIKNNLHQYRHGLLVKKLLLEWGFFKLKTGIYKHLIIVTQIFSIQSLKFNYKLLIAMENGKNQFQKTPLGKPCPFLPTSVLFSVSNENKTEILGVVKKVKWKGNFQSVVGVHY